MTQRLLGMQHAEANLGSTHASELIARYPHLSAVELTRLIDLYRELPALDVALMISDKALGPKLDRFFKDHGKKSGHRSGNTRHSS